MSSSEEERDAPENDVTVPDATGEREAKRTGTNCTGGEGPTAATAAALPQEQQQQQQPSSLGDSGPTADENQDHRPATLAYVQQHFGVMARVLEREVFRRGLINSSVDEMLSSFFMMSGVLMDILKMETNPHHLRMQLLEMLLTILEGLYSMDQARLLVSIMESTADDLYLFQGILSRSSLDILVQRAEEFMNPPTRPSGGSMSGGGIPGNYSGVANDTVRDVHPTYSNASALVRPSYGDFNADRRVEAAAEPSMPRGGGAYTEGGGVGGGPIAGQAEEEAAVAVGAGWGGVPRKHADRDRDVGPHHHHHHHVQQHRPPFNHYPPQQRHQFANVPQHHQVVVGTGPMGLQHHQHQQQQQQQQQQQEIPKADSFPRTSVQQGQQKRMMVDRVMPGVQEPDDAHVRGGSMWRGPLPPSGAQQDTGSAPQPSYHMINTPQASVAHANQHPHPLASPNSPTHSRPLVQSRHATPPFLPQGPMGKQAPPQPATQMSSQIPQQSVTTTVAVAPPASAPPSTSTSTSLLNAQRRVVPFHHHHHHHHHLHLLQHHHDIPPTQVVMARASPPSQPAQVPVKPEPVAPPETRPQIHNTETAVPQFRPCHFHHIPLSQQKVQHPPQSNVSVPPSLGGGGNGGSVVGGFSAGGNGAPSHGLMMPTHHHMIHHHIQQARPLVPPQQQQQQQQQQQPYRQSAPSAQGPMSIDALSNDDMNWTSSQASMMFSGPQELRYFLRQRGVPEPMINMLSNTFPSTDKLLETPFEAFDEQLKKEGISLSLRQDVWRTLHPNDKTLSEKDVPEMNELRSFMHNNSIPNNMSQEAEDGNTASTRLGRPGKAILQVPQPRTSQSKNMQSGKVGECKAIIWLSTTHPWHRQSVVEELSKHGKVLEQGESFHRPELFYCKLGDHKNELQTMRKVGVAVVKRYHRQAPGELDATTPRTPTGHSEDEDDNGANKNVRQKTIGSLNTFQQHPQQSSANRAAFGEIDEEDADEEENRNHRKGNGIRHARGRGRGGHHSYHHTHRHSEGSPVLCRFFSKGTCRNGDQCQFFHPPKNLGRSP